jgi:hypothetical protein
VMRQLGKRSSAFVVASVIAPASSDTGAGNQWT